MSITDLEEWPFIKWCLVSVAISVLFGLLYAGIILKLGHESWLVYWGLLAADALTIFLAQELPKLP